MHTLRLTLVCGFLCAVLGAHARPVTLVREGTACSTIVLAARPTRAAQLAACELQYHLQKITGATVPIASDADKVRGVRILVGASAATAKVLGKREADFAPQEYLLRATRDTLLLLGRDQDDRGTVDYARGTGFPGDFDAQGTCYAVYDFLERYGNVRWYGPTELELVYPRRPTLTVDVQALRRTPAFPYRQAWPPFAYGLNKELWNNAGPRDMALFWRRLRHGGQPYSANHSFYGYYDRFWEQNPQHPAVFEGKRPEFFAQGSSGLPPQMCYTNPAFIRQVIQDARDFFDGKGAKVGARALGDFFALVPMDNGAYCTCPDCRAELNKGAYAPGHFSNGRVSEYFFGFANKVAREIKKSHPDKYIATLAYADYAYYPQTVRLEPNIAVQLCLHVRNWWSPSIRENDMKIYRSWVDKEKERPIYLWLYYTFPEEIATNGRFRCFPGFFAHTAAAQIKMFHKDGIRGAFLNGLGEQVDTYITFKLFDDPDQDIDQLLHEFFTRYYGHAAEPMEALYREIERIYADPQHYPPAIAAGRLEAHQTEEIAWGYLGTQERMEPLMALMSRAKLLAATEIEQERVALFERGIWAYMMEGYTRHQRRLADAPNVRALRQTPPPSVTIPRVAAGAAGDPSRVDWTRAGRFEGWHYVDGHTTDRQVNALGVHDGQYLYVQLQEVGDLSRLATRDDIWSGDDWEIFVANARGRPYRQFGVNPAGKTQAAAIGEPTETWESGAVVTSDTKTAGAWTVRIAFPLDKLLPGGARPGATFYAHLYRATTYDDHLAWSANFTTRFHEVSRMGAVTLAE